MLILLSFILFTSAYSSAQIKNYSVNLDVL